MQVRRVCSQQHTCLILPLAKSQLTKANQSKAKIEGLARELQKVRPIILLTWVSLMFDLGEQTSASAYSNLTRCSVLILCRRTTRT